MRFTIPKSSRLVSFAFAILAAGWMGNTLAAYTGTWTQKSPTGDVAGCTAGSVSGLDVWCTSDGKPVPESWYPAVYDAARDRSVVFGGSPGRYPNYSNVMWAYDDQTDAWHVLEQVRTTTPGDCNPSGSPGCCPNNLTWPNGRDTHGLVYDKDRDVYWMHGGSPGRFCTEPDKTTQGPIFRAQSFSVWKYTPASYGQHGTWSVPAIASSDSWYALNSVWAYSTDKKYVLFWGGEDRWSNAQATFAYTTTAGSEAYNMLAIGGPANDTNSPLDRGQLENGSVYDEYHKVFIRFGGSVYDDGMYTGSAETWVFHPDTNAWERKIPAHSPPARAKHAMAYDSKRHIVVMDGGRYSYAQDSLGDTWYYDYDQNDWTEITASPRPPATNLHAMVYDSQHDMIIRINLNGSVTDVWTLKLTVPTPPSSPPPVPGELKAE